MATALGSVTSCVGVGRLRVWRVPPEDWVGPEKVVLEPTGIYRAEARDQHLPVGLMGSPWLFPQEKLPLLLGGPTGRGDLWKPL